MDAAPRFYEPFDPPYAQDMVRTVIGPLVEHYFRPQLLGAHRIPPHGPLILAANHSGTALPYDAIILDGFLWMRDDMRPERKMRSVFESALARRWWLRPLGVDNFWRRAGAVDMSFDNFERLLQRGDRVLYFPEGVPGIGKGFQHRYQLQPFHTSFVLLAWRYGVPVIPISIVNAEWIMPFHFTLKPIDWVFQRLFRVPFLPLPAGLLAIVFPWLWFLALPAQLVFVVGDPIDVGAMLREAGLAEGETPTRPQLIAAAERVRQEMQRALLHNVALHGGRPYSARWLWEALKKARGRVWRVLPTGWPLAVLRFERDRQRPPARNKLHAFVRDLDLLAFYLPAGWPILSLCKLLRRPPYGYRGLTLAERREREGNFFWKLRERPLPPRDAEFLEVEGAEQAELVSR